jgi:tRNA threonylcarbamoyladenosine biosynthesis protein TsaB
MLDLAIETSTSHGSIALGNDKVVVQSIDLGTAQRHSASLFPVLTRLGLPRLKIRRIIVGIGPGSFSGIRVGIAAAQGIALAQEVPVIGICSAWSIAVQFPQITRLGVFADAKRREAFCTAFANGEIERETYLLPMVDLEDHTAKFTLAVSAEPLPGIATRVYPRARDLLSFSESFPGWVRQQPLEPIYLREPVVPLPKKNNAPSPLLG